MSAGRLQTEIVSEAARLRELEPAWWDLFSRAPQAHPFQSPAWLLPWARIFASGAALRVIVVWERAMIGLLPLVLQDEGGRRTARLVGSGITDYLDALVDPSFRREALAALSEALRAIADEVDAIALTDVPSDSLLLELGERGWNRTCETCAVCPTIELRESQDALTRLMRPWLRRNVRQGRARLDRQGARWVCADERSVHAFVEALLSLHTSRFRARGEPGVLADPSVHEFHRLAAPALVAHGLLELSAGFVGERPIAAAYVLTRRDAYLYLTGFDPEFERCSAGSVIIHQTLQRAVHTRKRRYDFLRGAEPYKYAWGAKDSVTLRLRFEGAQRTSSASLDFRP